MDMKKIINKLQEVVDLLNQHHEATKASDPATPPPPPKPKKEPKPPEKLEQAPPANTSDFEDLKKLLNSGSWPLATPDFLICEDTDKDKYERADGILAYLGQDFKNKKFLDMGCGEGHVVEKVLAAGATVSVGFDLVKSGNLTWESDNPANLLTTDFDKVKANGPYDFIFIYDVLDHADEPVEVLKLARSVLNDNGKVFVRCHPICARHATHQYKKLNKAYIHLVFTEEEIKSLGLENDIKQKTFFPINDNNKWFAVAGFKVKHHDSVKSQVEDFFRTNKLVAARLTRAPYNKSFPEYQMQQVFNDYVLLKSE